MKKTRIGALMTVAAAFLFTVPSYAAGNKISTIRLEVTDKMQVDSALDEDEELEIDTSAKDYVVSGWEIMNSCITWDAADIPEVEVTLITEDDSYFSVTKSNVKLRGDEAEVVSVKKESSQELVVTLRLLPMSQRVGKIAYAEWDGKQAVWAPSTGAVSYDVYLFRDSRAVGSKRTTSDTTYDFGVALNKEGEYYYRVRPVGAEGTKHGVLTESDSIYRSEDQLAAERSAAAAVSEQTDAASTPSEESGSSGNSAAEASGTVTLEASVQSGNNGTSGNGAAEASGAVTSDASVQSGDNGSSGTGATEASGTVTSDTAALSGEAGSWIQDGTDWRFLRADGSQQQNDWLLIQGKWYYFEADGRMKTGWLLWKDYWYYLGPDGDMWVNTQTPDGYTVNQDGVWIS